LPERDLSRAEPLLLCPERFQASRCDLAFVRQPAVPFANFPLTTKFPEDDA
jgi:hypothetical protein